MNKLVHWEIPSTDLGKSKEFYAELFGWKMQDIPGGEYMVFDVDGGVGGGIDKVAKMPESGIQVYVEVGDIPAFLKKAEGLGGKRAQEKTEIGGNMGFCAAFLDPCGCRIGVWSKT